MRELWASLPTARRNTVGLEDRAFAVLAARPSLWPGRPAGAALGRPARGCPGPSAAQASGPGPLITGAATLASTLLAWLEGFPHLFGFFASSRLIPPSTGVCPFFPLPVERIPALLGFGGLCLRSVLSPSCRFEAHSSLLCTRSQLLQPCCPENELTVLKLLRLTRQLEKLIPLWSSLFFFFFKFLVCIVKTIVVSLGL